MFLRWGRVLLEFFLSWFSLQPMLHAFAIWLSWSMWLRALYFASPIFCPWECWHGGTKNRELQSNSHNSNSYLHQRQKNSDSESEHFWIFLGSFQKRGIFRLQVREVRLLWLCHSISTILWWKRLLKKAVMCHCTAKLHWTQG